MDFDQLQQDLPKIIVWAAPIMISLVILEYWLRYWKFKKKDDKKEMFAATLVGLGNVLSSGLTKGLVFALVIVVYGITPFKIPHTWWSYIVCIIVLDFCRYWAHRIAHEQRFWWATHVIHHSSETYNWAVSFRLSWVQQLKVIFFLPVAFIGIDPIVFFICHQIEVLYQFWIHTELIHKLPRPIEYIFTTPSHHRVHHATNKKYIDKNYGSTFIVWDRMFGTFQPEEEKANYGILKPVKSYNPVYLVFHEFIDMTKDISKQPKKAFKILFGHPNQSLTEEEKKEFIEESSAT